MFPDVIKFSNFASMLPSKSIEYINIVTAILGGKSPNIAVVLAEIEVFVAP